MSLWSYIKGYCEVDVIGRTQEEKEYILKTVLNHLPIVQGSEEDMYVHIIKAGGYNSSCNFDEYGKMTNNLKTMGYGEYYHTKEGYRHLQSNYYIFIEGHLRDREFSTTYKQFVRWLTRLSKRIQVELVDVVISGDYNREERICTSEFNKLYVYPSWLDMNNQYVKPFRGYNYNWCEHLMWGNEEDMSYD